MPEVSCGTTASPQHCQCNATAFHKQLRISRNICYANSTDDILKRKVAAKVKAKRKMVIRFLEIMVNLGLKKTVYQ